MVLQPSEERRRSGSHYTPRSLTEPIVRTTLEPVLDALRGEDGRPPRPSRSSSSRSATRRWARARSSSRRAASSATCWSRLDAHGDRPEIPADEDEVTFARRLVAQRCLYGVDRNPVAVDLAKMSLWLVTLAREHPLTFLDHALRHGDSLVGLITPADRRVPLEAGSSRASRRSGSASTSSRVAELRRADPRGRRGHIRLDAARPVGRGAARTRRRCGCSATSRSRRSSRRRRADERETQAAGVRARSRRTARAERYRGLARRAARGRAAAGAVPLAGRVPGGVRPRAAGIRRDRRQPAVRGQEHDSATRIPSTTSTG